MSKPSKSMEEVILADGRYPPEAFAFLHECLNHAVSQAHGSKPQPGTDPAERMHVSGEQICHASRDLALERWGMLARTVLARWGITATIDFGNMVYLLIEHGFMRKTEEDSVEDFRDVFDFEQALAVEPTFELKE